MQNPTCVCFIHGQCSLWSCVVVDVLRLFHDVVDDILHLFHDVVDVLRLFHVHVVVASIIVIKCDPARYCAENIVSFAWMGYC